MEQAVEVTDVLVGAGEQIAHALRCLRTGTEVGPRLVEIHRLENEGDRLQRDAVASLFAGGIDPMVVIRWKDIFGSLERCRRRVRARRARARGHRAQARAPPRRRPRSVMPAPLRRRRFQGNLLHAAPVSDTKA